MYLLQRGILIFLCNTLCFASVSSVAFLMLLFSLTYVPLFPLPCLVFGLVLV